MGKVIKTLRTILLSSLAKVLILVSLWWAADPGAQYYPTKIPHGMEEKLLHAIRYHGEGHVYRSDWTNNEFTFERNGQVIDTFAYLEEG